MSCGIPASVLYELEVQNRTTQGSIQARLIQLTHNYYRGRTVSAKETVIEQDEKGLLSIGGETDDEEILFALIVEYYDEDDTLNPALVGIKIFNFEEISRYPLGPDAPPIKIFVITDDDLHPPTELDSLSGAVRKFTLR